MTQQSPSPSAVLAVLREVDGELAAAVGALRPEQYDAASYASEWSIAQVMSHIGSASEIFGLFLGPGAAGTPAPGPEAFQPIWDVWNAKSAAAQVTDALAAQNVFLDQLAAMSDADRSAWHLEMFGEDRNLADVLLMRLAENALHAWDVLVTLDPGATVAPAAVELVIDRLGMITQFTGQTQAEPIDVTIITTSPDRKFRLRDSDGAVSLVPSDDAAEATLSLSAEGFIRLVYGRLDDAHTCDVTANGVTLNALRAVYPGP